ncbi:MAG: DUF4298 domain-containing protein [Clostridiales bacterium]|jgi:hypothetical protein|nr:DUF4298 domain-containing protein [Clostridia bacterium]MCR5682457.1 DUF4298 domain-containing protein [Clostridiales bacterium]
MKQLERIRTMEALLDDARAALDALNNALDGYEKVREEIDRLEAYYTGEDWRQDFEDDEEGRLPADLKRGVLSEDGIYDLLEDDREILVRLLETAADVLRRG